MSIIEAGGPAFPAEIGPPSDGCMVQTGDRQWLHPGMTLRDYFAAKAMQAAATNQKGADGFTFEERAQWAYLQADAMLEARK